MEIKCTRSIGNWFDDLSIFNVKINLSSGPNKDKNIVNFENLSREIKEVIGDHVFNQIISSDEYKELYRLNKIIFELIDLLRAENIKNYANWEQLAEYGVEIDERNSDRFVAKNNLQKKFFNTEIKEVKIGYMDLTVRKFIN